MKTYLELTIAILGKLTLNAPKTEAVYFDWIKPKTKRVW